MSEHARKNRVLIAKPGLRQTPKIASAAELRDRVEPTAFLIKGFASLVPILSLPAYYCVQRLTLFFFPEVLRTMTKVQDNLTEQRTLADTRLLRTAASKYLLRPAMKKISNRQSVSSNLQRKSLKTLVGGQF